MNKVEKLVSVIIPLYNHASYIQACLDSVFRQTYPHIELIVIDDGSSDQGPEFAKAHLSKCPYSYRFIQQENQGAHAAINKGIASSEGGYISILNSDDRFHEKRIHTLWEAAQSKEARFIFSKLRHIGAEGKPIANETLHPFYYQKTVARSEIFPTRCFEFLRQNMAVTSSNFFFQRELYQEVGPFRDLKVCHDWDFLLRSLLLENPIFLNDILLDYRVHSGNTIQRFKNRERAENDIVLASYLEGMGKAKNAQAPGPNAWGIYWNVFVDVYMDHASRYPKAWKLLQESKIDPSRELTEEEIQLIHSLKKQAAYSFEQTNRLLHYYQKEMVEKKKRWGWRFRKLFQ